MQASLALLLGLLLSSCTKQVHALPVRVGQSALLDIPGIGNCGDPASGVVALTPGRPLAVLVHGCMASERDFGTLAKIFSLHDQQTVCFRYDDRARLSESAATLRTSISRLVKLTNSPSVMVLGHSQGGLVSRIALTKNEQPLAPAEYKLVTVSSPFNGIRAARDCGSIPLHFASLGMTLAVCRAVSGAKWNEIHARSTSVRAPTELETSVREHLNIVTDERDTCRTYSPDGRRCVKDDYVFSVAEQRNARMERDERVFANPVNAGHSEIVGARGDTPKKLLSALQDRGILRGTRTEEELAVKRLTARLGW